tara:strand:+ start:2995 stop:4035 length:1041 start_codon:yes stop_codon:yes gene_type:complete
MKIKDSFIENLVLQKDSKFNLYLFVGTDYGLSNKRLKTLVNSLEIDTNDPFSCSRLEQEDLENNPSRLTDESLTPGLNMSGRLVIIRIYDEKQSLNVLNSIKSVLEQFPIRDTKIIILAKNLLLSSTLAKIIGSDPNCALIASYKKDGVKIKDEIRLLMSKNKINTTNEVLDFLVSNLGDDHLITLNKIDKIFSYIYPRKEITYRDVELIISDSRSVEVDSLIFCIFTGNTAQTVKNIDFLYSSGISSIQILKALTRWALNIKIVNDLYKSGESVDNAIKYTTPNIFWKIRPKFELSLKLCRNLNLNIIIERLLSLEKKIKSNPNNDATLLAYSILGIANLVRNND